MRSTRRSRRRKLKRLLFSDNKVIFYLAVIMLILEGVKIFLSNNDPVGGWEYQILEDQVREEDVANQQLEAKNAYYRAYTTIEQEAKDMGFSSRSDR